MEQKPKSKIATEVVFNEAGDCLFARRYHLSGLFRVGETWIEDYIEYKVLESSLTIGKHGGALVEYVVKVIADRSPKKD